MKNVRILALSLLPLAAAHSQTVTATATPSAITFSYQIGAANLPAAQVTSVKSSSGTPAFTTAITGVNALWLTVSPDTGKLPASISLRVNPTSLSAGVYTAAVTVTITGVANPLSIPVTLNITSPPPVIGLSTNTLSFSAPPLPPPAQTVTLSTAGAPASFTATSGTAWLQVSPSVGVVLPGDQVSLTITVDPSTLNPQATPYSGKITVTQTGTSPKTQNITVSLTVNSSAPTITNVWPATLPIGAGAQTITVRGTNFYSATSIKLQGVAPALVATILSPSALLAVVPAANLTAAATLNVIASNPAPGGDSAPAPLQVANVPSIGAVTNVASYAAAAVSPGELATIFGSNLGPATPASMDIVNGFASTSVGGVTVTIDGQAAPLLYVSQNQITVQVPYEVTQGAGKQVVVTNGQNAPATSTVTVALQAPGLFTSDGSGVGQAAVLNYSATTALYTLNTGSNPAKPGDTVILYLTGEGDYNQALSPRTGLIIPSSLNPLPQLSPLPTVTIGGASATVAYAGPLVGSILGLLQINAVVPAGATTGQAVPVVINIGGTNSQSSTTLSIHP